MFLSANLMNPTSQSLVFSPSPTSVAVSVAFVGVIVVLAWMGWKRSGYRTSIGFLEVLRVLIAVAIAIT